MPPIKTRKPRVPKKADDKEQSEAFIKAAREAETDNDPETFEEAFKAVSKAPKPGVDRPRPSVKRPSS